ncbi:hypothetical protein PSTT_14191 [Puccinia striiformis]|uniref:Dynein heavy chain linker domain-containing protein n=2 Tax=Puccinia striiformis TaxID=27350 RepID=A0A2S4UN97_9BASI|nr:hypothetical protein PSTT_14191 [Puccinia striiformis]
MSHFTVNMKSAGWTLPKSLHWTHKDMFSKHNVKDAVQDVVLPEVVLNPYSPTTLTIWNMDLKQNEWIIHQVSTHAAGEVALKKYIKQVKETWNGYGLDLVNYQNKTQPIRGWNNLFNKCSEHSATWAQMKFSPHYRTYDEDVKTWTN